MARYLIIDLVKNELLKETNKLDEVIKFFPEYQTEEILMSIEKKKPLKNNIKIYVERGFLCDEDKKIIVDKLKKIKTKEKLSKRALAIKIGITQKVITNFFNFGTTGEEANMLILNYVKHYEDLNRVKK